MNKLLFLLLAALPVQLYGQISAPESVDSGEAIHFTYPSAEAGDELRWLLLNPFDEVKITEIQTRFGTDYIVDPPCGWAGKIRIQVIVLDADKRVKAIEIAVVDVKQGNAPINPPTPPPNPDETGPDDGKLPEYTGENALGVGIISYANAPEYNAEVADIMRRAAQYLRGYPSLKVVYLENGDPNSDKLVYVWINKELKSLNLGPEWKKWQDKVFDYEREMGITKGSPVALHVQFLNESASGIDGHKNLQ